jgi:hypothetical protein
MFSKECKLHLEEAKMTHWQHFRFAWWFLFQLKKAEIALFVHSFVPRYFKTYASDKIIELAKILETKNEN